MRKKYLFSLLYLVGLGLSFLIPNLGDFLFIVIAPVAIPISLLSEFIDGPRDTAIPALIAGILQFFVLGLVWDWIADWIGRDMPHR